MLNRRMRWTCAALFVLLGQAVALDVKVMSYNIRYGTAPDGENAWTNRSALLIDQLRQYDADTIGLQEALRFQIDEIRAALPQYDEVGVGREGGTNGEYSCILYDTNRFTKADAGTFWLSSTPGQVSQDWDAACIRICTWALLVEKESGDVFYHYNTHLDHRSETARLNGVYLIAERIHAGDRTVPFVLTGDFNAAEESPPLRYLKGETCDYDSARTRVPMVDSFRVLHPLEQNVGTGNGFRQGSGGAKIDYIMTAPESKVLAAGIDFSMPGGRYISDHFPVTATLRFPQQGSRSDTP